MECRFLPVDSILCPVVCLNESLGRFIANRRFARLLLGRRDSRPGPARPCHFVTHLSRTHGWGTWRLNDDLKLGESTFLNTLSRLTKVPAPEEIARYPNWKSSFCHALSRTCHAPVMTKSMLILLMTKESFGLHTALRASYLYIPFFAICD